MFGGAPRPERLCSLLSVGVPTRLEAMPYDVIRDKRLTLWTDVPRYGMNPGRVGQPAGRAGRPRLIAALMSERCVNAWGKLPSCSPVSPISSAYTWVLSAAQQ